LPALSPDEPERALAHPPSEPSPSTEAQCRWRRWTALADALTPVLMAPQGQPHALECLQNSARELIALCHEDADMGIFFMVHDTPDKLRRYGVLHAVHTATLLTLVARRRDWSPGLTLSAVLAGLTMNLSITPLQSELARQTTPLTASQRAHILAHPQASHDLLVAMGVTDAECLTAVAQHHEQSDGKGYPARIACKHLLADAVRTCDIYSAKMSPRVGRSVVQGPQATTQIFRERSANYFGATLTREMGLYPPGSLIELNDGRLAVVVRRGRDLSLPEVVALSDASGPTWRPVARFMTTDRGTHIVAASEVTDWGLRIDPEAVLSHG